MANKTGNLYLENARIIFRNFSGRETQYNRAGSRNFCVIVDDENVVKDMERDGWNVKTTTPRDPDDEPQHYIKVNVRFDNYPPDAYLICGKTKTRLDENTIGALDYADITNVDLVISPSRWEFNKRSGISGYLKKIYVTIEEDKFAAKYAEEEFPVEDDLPWN